MKHLRLASRCWALLLAALFTQPLAAANPQLSALVNGVDDKKSKSSMLRIDDLAVRVRVHGGVAETEVTARFHNDGEDRLEGKFVLQMPQGSVVTGYALDVAGRMVDGVLVDQIEARRAYEARVRERIDPGLGEVSRGFQFTTRVYPIEANSARKVRVRFVTPVDPATGYELPLAHGAPIGQLSLAAEASGFAAPPRLVLPNGRQVAWDRTGSGWRGVWVGRNAPLDGSFALAPGSRSSPMLTGRGSAGGAWFEIADSGPAAGTQAPRPQKVAILWDRSLSRGDDLLSEEIALLEAWLRRARPAAIELVLFDGGGVERVAVRDREDLVRRLGQVRYRGATSIAALAEAPIRADSCLLFTDGLVTLGRRVPLTADCPLTILSSAVDSDRPWLNSLARGARGEALHLTAANRPGLLDRMTRPGVRVAEARAATGERIDAVLLDAPSGGWRLVGPLPRGGSVVVRLAGLDGGADERTYTAPTDAAAFAGAEGLWAADRLAVRSAGEEDRDTLIAFARRHSVAGPDISFLVLETPEDYAESRIDPPSTYPAAQRAEYDALVVERRREGELEKKERFDDLLARWEAQKTWWNTRFDPNAKADPDETRGSSVQALPPPPPPPPPPPSAPPQPGAEPGAGDRLEDLPQSTTVTGSRIPQPSFESATPVTVVGGGGEGADISVTGAKIAAPPASAVSGASSPPAAPEVEAAEWAPDRPYLIALRAARPKDRERVLAEQQKAHGALPAFWLDVSEYYRRAGRKDEALRLLLSALELPTRDSETLGIVAERLIRWGDVETAIALYERMTAVDREHPHPKRGLALALAKRAAKAPPAQAKADLARAIAILSELVLSVDDDEYEGFNIVALTELNAIVAQYRRLGGTEVPLDPRLIANLDLDLRIVVEWKSEQIDVDMWVKEPNGEVSSYWNDDTRIGGRLSEETTDGSGPEQYLLRRAPNGDFTVKAEIWSDDPINPNGAARIIARFIRDFGRPSQREEMIEVELLPQDEDEDSDDADATPVGKVRVRR